KAFRFGPGAYRRRSTVGEETMPDRLPISRQTLGIQTVAAIRELILRGDLKEGEPVRQEALSERLQVSRVPVREALVQLEAEGLLTYAPHHGAVVAKLSLDEISELFALRALLEVDLLRRAIPQITALD